MQTVNKKMDPKKTLQTMQDFQKENLKMGMTEDMSENIFFKLLFWLTLFHRDIFYTGET